MTNEEIEDRAQIYAHENSKACQNRAAVHQRGHGAACVKLAKQFAAAMREARDA